MDWVAIASMNVARGWFTLTTVGNQILAAGGSTTVENQILAAGGSDAVW